MVPNRQARRQSKITAYTYTHFAMRRWTTYIITCITDNEGSTKKRCGKYIFSNLIYSDQDNLPNTPSDYQLPRISSQSLNSTIASAPAEQSSGLPLCLWFLGPSCVASLRAAVCTPSNLLFPFAALISSTSSSFRRQAYTHRRPGRACDATFSASTSNCQPRFSGPLNAWRLPCWRLPCWRFLILWKWGYVKAMKMILERSVRQDLSIPSKYSIFHQQCRDSWRIENSEIVTGLQHHLIDHLSNTTNHYIC